MEIAAALASAIWLFFYLRTFWNLAHLEHLEKVPITEEQANLPSLSIVVPACNEAHTLEPAVRTMLGQKGCNLELVLIDDRSTDGTHELADRLAERDPRVKVIHIESLPCGWLGKVNALREGSQACTSDVVLFCDADVHFAPGILQRTLRVMQQRKLDQLVVLPWVECPTFPLKVFVAAFSEVFFAVVNPSRISRPGRKGYVGAGTFCMVRRSWLERMDPFLELRMEVADDLGLGYLLKQAGARPAVFVGVDSLSLTWYRSARDMVKGFEKNTFGALMAYRYRRVVALAALIPLIVIGPLYGASFAHHEWVRVLSTAALAVFFSYQTYSAIRARRSPLPGYCVPLGYLLMVYAVVRSAWACFRNRGIIWRGTHYPLAELRRGRRVPF